MHNQVTPPGPLVRVRGPEEIRGLCFYLQDSGRGQARPSPSTTGSGN